MISHDEVLIERDSDVATVTINRPERRNALGSTQARALGAAIADASRGSRAVILTGAGGAFCAGGDLEELERWSDLSEEEIGGFLYETFQGMIRAIRHSDAIVVAAVDGPAVGAGMDLALACDLKVAGQGARFGQIWVRLGVIPGTGGAWLTQMLAGPTRAAELLLTGDLISGEAALAAGLVNKVVPDDQVLFEARLMVDRVLRHPPMGVIANKRAMVTATDAAVEAALVHAAEVQPGRFTSDEFRTAVGAARRATADEGTTQRSAGD